MPAASPFQTPPSSLWLPSLTLNKFNPFEGGQIPKYSLLPFLPKCSLVDNPMILQGTNLKFEAPSIWKQPLSLWCLRNRHFCPGCFYSNGDRDTWDLSCHSRKLQATSDRKPLLQRAGERGEWGKGKQRGSEWVKKHQIPKARIFLCRALRQGTEYRRSKNQTKGCEPAEGLAARPGSQLPLHFLVSHFSILLPSIWYSSGNDTTIQIMAEESSLSHLCPLSQLITKACFSLQKVETSLLL